MNQVDMDRGLAYTVLQPFKFGPRALQVGDVVTLPEPVAISLINQGKAWPVGMAMLSIFSNYLHADSYIVCINGDRRTPLPEGDVVKAIKDLSGNRPQDETARAFPGSQSIKKRRK